ncbi:MAG: thrombospondin type 3 repeat-containing protein [Lachnospiraceae bacterium]|nr:thrombospondin type 3 repeat-containing protein [Lachnospiraceae bacterium]
MNSKGRTGLKRFLIFLIVVGLIFTAFFAALKIMQKKRLAKEFGGSDLIDTTLLDKRYKELAAEPSDIEGMTKADKVNAGLSPDDNSDTDMDGLSDKDEILVYGTDPLKASTAGDMYFDGEKVSAGLDLHKKYDTYDEAAFGPIVYPLNVCRNITLTGKTASDRTALVKDVTGSFDMYEGTGMYKWKDKYNSYAEYEVRNFEGDLSIDLGPVLERRKKTMGDIIALTAIGTGDAVKASYKTEGNTIALSAPKDAASFLVIIADKKTKNPFSNILINAVGTASETATAVKQRGKAVVVYSQAANAITKGGIRPKIYYVSSGDESKDNAMLSTMIACANRALPDIENTTSKDCREVSLKNYEFRLKLYGTFLKNRHASPDIGQYYLSYWTYDDELGISEEMGTDAWAQGGTSASGMEKFSDNETFPFTNFGSYISNGGNCAGITGFTAALYNKGSVPATGSFDFGEGLGTISYDLTKDIENATLLDRGLKDYKDESFVTDRSAKDYSLDNSKLTAGELDFVNAIGCYWGVANTRPTEPGWNDELRSPLKRETIENMKAMLDKNKVIILSASIYEPQKLANGITSKEAFIGGHSILLYGYSEYKKVDPYGDEHIHTDFYVYDPNCPNNHTTNIMYFEEYTVPEHGYFAEQFSITGGQMIAYSYNPIGSYCMYDCAGILDQTYLSITDEDYNSLIVR